MIFVCVPVRHKTGKAKADMTHCDCGWTCGCAGKTEIPWEHVTYLSASEAVFHREALHQVCVLPFYLDLRKQEKKSSTLFEFKGEFVKSSYLVMAMIRVVNSLPDLIGQSAGFAILSNLSRNYHLRLSPLSASYARPSLACRLIRPRAPHPITMNATDHSER